MFELDHLFVATPDPEAAIAELEAAGFTLGARGVHQGQGTANAVYFFDDVYLELLWIDDPDLAARPTMALSGLPARLRGQPGVSPFGVSFRYRDGADRSTPLPVPTWDWPAPFLPLGAVPIPIATSSSRLAEPLIFASLVTRRPDRRDVARQAALGVREVTELSVTVAGASELSPTLRRMEALGIAAFRLGDVPSAVATLDGGEKGEQIALTHLPLTLLR